MLQISIRLLSLNFVLIQSRTSWLKFTRSRYRFLERMQTVCEEYAPITHTVRIHLMTVSPNFIHDLLNFCAPLGEHRGPSTVGGGQEPLATAAGGSLFSRSSSGVLGLLDSWLRRAVVDTVHGG